MTSPSSPPRRTILGNLAKDVRGLAKAPRDLWIVFAVKLIESVAYFAVLNVLILYLHDDLRFDDYWAGAIFGAWGTVVALLTFVAGFIADAMGQRKALLIAALVAVVSRAMLVTSDIPAIPLIGLAIGTWTVASMKPVMTASVKRHAPPEVRPFAYSVFYVVMNLGALLAGWLVSGLRISLLGRVIRPSEVFGDAPPVAAEPAREALVTELATQLPPPDGAEADVGVRSFARVVTGGRDFDYWTSADLASIRDAAELAAAGQPIPDAPFGLSGYEMIFLVSVALSVLSLLLLRSMSPDPPPPEGETQAKGALEIFAKAGRIGAELFKEKTFWAFLLFIFLLALVRAIFAHAHSTWPTYMLREFGQSTPQAALWSLNPALIVVLTPFIGSATSRFSAWSVIMTGSFITAASVLFMTIPGVTEPLARTVLEPLFGDALDYRLAGPVLFIITLSVGEALWSPRLYEYVAVMAPPGREASYMGLTLLPLFFAKILVGFMTGWLTTSYCPEHGDRQPEILWLIVFATTLAGPIIAIAFAGVIRAAERQRLAEAEGAPREF